MISSDSELAAYKTALESYAIVGITDRRGRIVEVNDRFCETSKYSREELIGQKQSIVSSDYHPKAFFVDMWRTVAAGKTWKGEIRNRAKDGSTYWVLTTIVPMLAPSGSIQGYMSIRYDITARKDAEETARIEVQRRRGAEALLLELIEAMPSGVAAFDEGDRLVFCNSTYRGFFPNADPNFLDGLTFEQIVRYAAEGDIFERPKGISSKELEVGISDSVRRHREAGSKPLTHKLTDGRWMQVQGRPAATGHIVEVATDISAIKDAETALRERIKIDPLTGIFNRIGLEADLARTVSEYEKSGAHFGLALLDVDHFKQVNDRFGHGAGDAALRVIAERLNKLPGVRSVARTGGDEFAIIIDLSQLDRKELGKLAEHSRKAVFRPILVDGKSILVSGSVGVATFPDDAADVEKLKQSADTALLVAKRSGRSRVQVVNSAIQAAQKRRRLIETDLRGAIAGKKIRPAYQPIVSAGEHSLKGLEVLARWEHPEIGPISPDEFITIALESGLLADLDQMMLEQACKEARDWLESGLVECLSLNASPTEIIAGGFATHFLATLRKLNINPSWVCLEVLESSIIDNFEEASRNLNRLKEAGVKIALDDFGTGFSNLKAALSLPLNGVKFDRSLIQELSSHELQRSAVKSIATLCQSFGLYTVAEGIETIDQMAKAEEAGCAYLQGYLFGRPMLFSEAHAFVRRSAIQKKLKSDIGWVA